MMTINSIRGLRRALVRFRAEGRTIGLVPTMGALHEGHLSLIRRSKKECDVGVVSIFVNPTQFGPREDYARYPRPKALDCRLAREAGADIVFYPSPDEMYPPGHETVVDVPVLSRGLCGASRPGHFRGVATIVAKLFIAVMPDRAYFGEKDFQQTAVIRRMTRDLGLPIAVRVCPTVRAADGLALSSRNQYLSSREREEAVVLYQALREARRQVRAGERSARVLLAQARRRIRSTSGRIDYLECVDAATLEPVQTLRGPSVMAAAVFFGRTRLIDNIALQI